MARVFITGSADGLGFLAGKILVEQGHSVILHARTEARATETRRKLPGCDDIVTGDVSTLAAMHAVARQVNALGTMDAVVHNVGLGDGEARLETGDGFTRIFAVNVLAPYVLTASITRPKRIIYLSSGMHLGGQAGLEDPQWKNRRWNASQAYSDTKLQDTLLAMALARRWPETLINAVDPGWVPTRMGGPGAPDDLMEGAITQAWLAVSEEKAAKVSGQYFYHKKSRTMNPIAKQEVTQDLWMDYWRNATGLSIE